MEKLGANRQRTTHLYRISACFVNEIGNARRNVFIKTVPGDGMCRSRKIFRRQTPRSARGSPVKMDGPRKNKPQRIGLGRFITFEIGDRALVSGHKRIL